MVLIADETSLRPDVHLFSTRYLKNGALHFIKVIEYNNINFNCKIVEDEDGKDDGKKRVPNLKEEAKK